MEVEEDRNQDKAEASDPHSSSETAPEKNPPSPPRKTRGSNRVSLLLPEGKIHVCPLVKGVLPLRNLIYVPAARIFLSTRQKQGRVSTDGL